MDREMDRTDAIDGAVRTLQIIMMALFSTGTILGGAILEGAAFMNLVAFLLEGQGYSLLMGLLLLIGLLAGIPTRRGAEDWLERQSHP